METPIKVSIVNYLNAKPFLYGLRHANLKNVSLQLDIPSVCAQKLISGEVSLGLVPVAILPQIPQPHIYTSYCIGAEGPVSSVMLYSHVPLQEIKTILLDFHSRSSVALVKILAKEYWQLSAVFLPASQTFLSEINDATAAVVIGDRTFALNGTFPYQYDLAEEWIKHTHLPFVFAAWIANAELPSNFVEQFNAALTVGIKNIPAVVSEELTNYGHDVDVENYLTSCISYDLNAKKRDGMALFLDKLKKIN